MHPLEVVERRVLIPIDDTASEWANGSLRGKEQQREVGDGLCGILILGLQIRSIGRRSSYPLPGNTIRKTEKMSSTTPQPRLSRLRNVKHEKIDHPSEDPFPGFCQRSIGVIRAEDSTPPLWETTYKYISNVPM